MTVVELAPPRPPPGSAAEGDGPPDGSASKRPNVLMATLLAAGILVVCLTEFRPVAAIPGNLSDTLFLSALALSGIGWLFGLRASTLRVFLEGVREVSPFLWGGLALALGGAIASLGSAAPAVSWGVTLKYLVTFCLWLPWMAFAAGRILSLARMHGLYLLALGFASTATMSDVLLGTRFGIWLVSGDKRIVLDVIRSGRYGGPLGHPNTLGYVTALGFGLCLHYAISAPTRFQRLAAVVGLMLHAAAVLVSGSRSALITMAVAWMIVTALAPRRMTGRLVGLPILCVLAVWGISAAPLIRAVLPVNPAARIAESVSSNTEFTADQSRKADLQAARDLLERDPFTGYGMENVGTELAPTVGFTLHDTILQSWMAGGLLAAIGAVWLYGATLLLGWRAIRLKHPLAPGLVAAAVGFILMDLVQPHFYARFKWLTAIMLVAAVREAEAGRKRDMAGGAA